ncbi:metalloregulator ArsR/SmtB family transcription factor [Pseudodesulfovibrio cashew]|uniref:Metalloregulator ArsR/SmtB family transcription factor n=1 Tax=Pseudodesulfovibrio cashew TaxID=2678688 RepID=A0A6I6JLA2_9BACT|nr:metalloregulator ArsR/SmtB family transcription factor [Pseudodesulfovibrio cashew]QGY41780.1 metalloregulator ArsR/SmtB family transcription factor [Pseudodesulfovibrio cashew]
METLATALKGLTEPIRLRILNLLRNRELCVCDLMEVLEIPQSTISRHLSYLRKAGWIESRKGGKWTYHRRSEKPTPLLVSVFAALDTAFAQKPIAQEDNERLARWLETKDEHHCNDTQE